MKNFRCVFLTIMAALVFFSIFTVVFFDYSLVNPKVVEASVQTDIQEVSVDDIEQPTPTPMPTPEPTPTPTDTVITIMAAGDTMAHESQLEHDYNEDPNIYDFMPSFAGMKNTISRADFAMVNLETTISGKELGYSGYPDFNTPESFVEALMECGFDLVGLGNNHILDRGIVGIKNTLENLEELGIDYTGLSMDEQSYYDYYIKDIEGIKVAVLVYAWETSAVNAFENSEYILRFWEDIDGVKADIQNVKNLGADVVIMAPHWGTEYHRQPSKTQVKLAEQYISFGVDIIFGSHPHVVQPIEKITTEDENGNIREGIVAYSMGNFLANMRNRYNNTGVVVEVKIRKTPDGKVSIDEVYFVPTLIKSTKIYKIEASDHEILPAGKYVNNPDLLAILDEEHQEKIIDAYNDVIELVNPLVATPLDE